MSVARPHATSLSVLVPTYGRSELLPRVVGAWVDLFEHAADELTCQLVVVNDGSPDDTGEVLEALTERFAPHLTTVQQPNRGRAAARNAAIEASRGELLLFADDDMLPLTPDLLDRHLDSQAEQPGAWVSHLQVPDECARTPFQAYWRRRLHGGSHRLAAGSDLGHTGFWFASLSLPRTLLGAARFDESFRGYGWEEHELGYRLHLAGVRARFLRGAYLAHYDPVTLEGTFEKHVAMGRAAWTFSRLHPGPRVALWTGTHALSLAWRRIMRLERRATALFSREGNSKGESFSDAEYRLMLEGAYSLGLRLGGAGNDGVNGEDGEVPGAAAGHGRSGRTHA